MLYGSSHPFYDKKMSAISCCKTKNFIACKNVLATFIKLEDKS